MEGGNDTRRCDGASPDLEDGRADRETAEEHSMAELKEEVEEVGGRARGTGSQTTADREEEGVGTRGIPYGRSTPSPSMV